MGKQPLVSICMITYDHEPFIAQAIEGVLGQQAEFEIELVIGDDVSTDATGRICREYQAKYPSTVRVLERSHNLGIALNFMTTLEACEGKYVAICEGDDYWTDPRKLQKQVDYMESRPALAVCHHRLQIRDEGKGRLLGITPDSKSVSSFADL
ncbi:MAG: glycosyltransferase, partial [Acidobacteria bacterium]|nr:glycosyltransferase [Acidobacteriota bacterium]